MRLYSEYLWVRYLKYFPYLKYLGILYCSYFEYLEYMGISYFEYFKYSENFRVSSSEARVILSEYFRELYFKVLRDRVFLEVFYPDNAVFLGSILAILGVLRIV